VVHASVLGPFPPGAEPEVYDRLRRRVLWTMPSGLYVLGSRAGHRRNLMTLNWATQLSLDPKLVGVSVEESAVTCELVKAGRCFALSVVGRQDRAAIRHFVKPAVEDAEAGTLAGHPYRDAAVTGAPIPDIAAAWIDCRLHSELSLGSHRLFVGEVVDAGFAAGVDEELEPLRMEDTRMSYGG
jgi:flavin reductase (DIM6/NTAB) family NADH-FMN oxidoreductase RutF